MALGPPHAGIAGPGNAGWGEAGVGGRGVSESHAHAGRSPHSSAAARRRSEELGARLGTGCPHPQRVRGQDPARLLAACRAWSVRTAHAFIPSFIHSFTRQRSPHDVVSTADPGAPSLPRALLLRHRERGPFHVTPERRAQSRPRGNPPAMLEMFF